MTDIKTTSETEVTTKTENLINADDVVSMDNVKSAIQETTDPNDKRLKLDEESENFKTIIRPMWKQQAEAVKTMDEAKGFADRMFKMYIHDYGTIVHACHYVMVAAFNGFNRTSPHGSITGFQASCLGHMMFKYFSADTAEYYQKLCELEAARKEIFTLAKQEENNPLELIEEFDKSIIDELEKEELEK